MWFFRSPQIVFGEDSLSWIREVKGKKAFIVTDETMQARGYLALVEEELQSAGLQVAAFTGVEPDPCLQTARIAADEMRRFGPDWIIGLGGGSSLDAAKAAWFLYACPDADLDAMNPLDSYGLHDHARFLTIPTTAGSGADVSWGAVILDPSCQRKIEFTSPEIQADITIIDPRFTMEMPPKLTADTGIDALSHAVEAYICPWANEFSDSLCLQAVKMIFNYLPRAYENGAQDPEAREKMALAASLAGLGMTNSHIALAHAMGHSLGALFHLPHGRVTGLCLPYTIEFMGQNGADRMRTLLQVLGQSAADENQAAFVLAAEIRTLMQKVGLFLSLREMGIPRQEFEMQLEPLCERAVGDISLATTLRIPSWDEVRLLFEYVYEGKRVDF